MGGSGELGRGLPMEAPAMFSFCRCFWEAETGVFVPSKNKNERKTNQASISGQNVGNCLSVGFTATAAGPPPQPRQEPHTRQMRPQSGHVGCPRPPSQGPKQQPPGPTPGLGLLPPTGLGQTGPGGCRQGLRTTRRTRAPPMEWFHWPWQLRYLGSPRTSCTRTGRRSSTLRSRPRTPQRSCRRSRAPCHPGWRWG